MFINKLGLKNFKCFKEVEVDFSKITLLTGENSSGKSSLIYGLLAPFQSEGFPLYLFPNGKYVNMGDFEEISFKNSKNNKIEINIASRGFWSDYISTQWILDSVNKLPKLYHLKTLIDDTTLDISLDGDTYLCNLYNADNAKLIQEVEITEFGEFYFYPENKDILRISKIMDNFLDWRIDLELDRTLNFIGSYRIYPERTYYQKPKSSRQILTSGEGYIDQILEWQEKMYREFNELITILKDLKLLYGVKPQKFGGGRFDLKVKIKKSSNWASLADVGFGVSQLLPIIVADLQLDDNSTLIMAQPETHLHPSIQAELGTYLVKQVNQSEKQYIVETHSEYLINRLRLCIVKGEIKPEDVAVYYFENTAKEGSIAHRVEFTKHGQIFNAPQGFFDTYMMDTMNIALNA
jgi:predicted ATPase